MLLFLIILFIVYAVNREKILRHVSGVLMDIIHRIEYSKREVYKFLYRNNLL